MQHENPKDLTFTQMLVLLAPAVAVWIWFIIPTWYRACAPAAHSSTNLLHPGSSGIPKPTHQLHLHRGGAYLLQPATSQPRVRTWLDSTVDSVNTQAATRTVEIIKASGGAGHFPLVK